VKQRVERRGQEIQSILAELLARGEVKDPRVRQAGLVTLTRVHVTGDLREAKVAFTVFGAPDAALERVRQGLASAAAHLQRALGRRLKARNTPTLEFEIDRALDQAFKVDALLREVAATEAKPAEPSASAEPSESDARGDEAGDAGGHDDDEDAPPSPSDG
jgi:ribosome-binding factor A